MYFPEKSGHFSNVMNEAYLKIKSKCRKISQECLLFYQEKGYILEKINDYPRRTIVTDNERVFEWNVNVRK